MSTVEEIERAIEHLPDAEFARLREWFDERDAQRFDDKIERDAKSGKLDDLVLLDHRASSRRSHRWSGANSGQ